MTRFAKIAVVVVLLGVGVAVYPSAHASYVRHRAESRLEEAEAQKNAMSSPVAKDILETAMLSVRFAIRQPDTDADAIARADAALVDAMQSLKTSPPPDHPVASEADYAHVVQAGESLAVTMHVRSEMAQAYLVGVTVQVGMDGGWKSEEIRQDAKKPMARDAPVDVRVEVPIPKDVSGEAWVRTSIMYRLDPTGEGQDLIERAAGKLPTVTIVK